MLLEARNLRKSYPTQRGKIAAVDGLDLEARPGEFLAVCGRSGSGKSTLLGMLGGLCRPCAGAVRIDGVDLWSLGRGALADFRARRLGFMFQFTGLLPNLRAVDNIALPPVLAGVGYAEAYGRARVLLGQVGLEGRWDAYPGELSGGEQRRVALARALSNRPVLLLADEPTNDLDEQAEREVLALLSELRQQHDTTLIVVTHDPQLARQADRVIYLQSGKLVSVVESGPVWPGNREGAAKPQAADGGRSRLSGALPDVLPPEPAAALATTEPTPPGEGLGRFLVGFTGWTLLVVCGLWGTDYLTARLQRKAIVQKQAERRKAEDLALQKLRAELDEVAYRADGGYEASVFLQNYDAQAPIYVLGPAVRVFVQVNRTWREVPASPVGFTDSSVQEVTRRKGFRFTFRVDLPVYDELLRGYMHVRVTNVMVVGERAEPTGDLFQRTDDYYVYLKPQKVSEEEVRQRNGWKPGSLVPRWIGMPAH